jgi:hypothetical protein
MLSGHRCWRPQATGRRASWGPAGLTDGEAEVVALQRPRACRPSRWEVSSESLPGPPTATLRAPRPGRALMRGGLRCSPCDIGRAPRWPDRRALVASALSQRRFAGLPAVWTWPSDVPQARPPSFGIKSGAHGTLTGVDGPVRHVADLRELPTQQFAVEVNEPLRLGTLSARPGSQSCLPWPFQLTLRRGRDVLQASDHAAFSCWVSVT